MPYIHLHLPVRPFICPGVLGSILFSDLASIGARVSSISELFPEPETPVTHVSVPSEY